MWARHLTLRPVIACLPALVAVVLAWSLLEDPASWKEFLAAIVLAALPGLVRAPRPRATLSLVAAGSLLSLAFRTWPHSALDAAWTALHDAPAVRAPFDPGSYPLLDGLVVAIAFGLGLATTLAVAARRPMLAGAVVAAAVGFPAVLLEDAHALRLGVLALASVLWCSVALGVRDVRRAPVVLAVSGGVVAASAGLAVAGLQPSDAHLDWRGWDPFSGSGRVADVRFVWDASYAGIEFPVRSTVVLRIRAPKRAQYWRVSTLETFADDRWIENLFPVAIGGPRRALPPDPLAPRRDAKPAEWLKQVVTVEGLEDPRVVAAGQPARIDGPSLGRLSYLGGGVMRAGRPIRRGSEYIVWSYEPRPTPRALASAPARYPDATDRYLELGRARLPGYGSEGREAMVDAVFRDQRYQPLWPYRALWEDAVRQTRRARSSYEATLLLERWFRRDGGFRYEEHPPGGVNPPLVDFVEVNRAGYCQHYAGAMAVMLRLLGIPARVAVGFTSGTWKGGIWTVTDHQAHAWVEAWFAGYGWMTFDPTPGRGTLSAAYTFASDSADVIRALGSGRFDFSPQLTPSRRGATAPPVDEEARSSIPWWLLAILAAPVAAASVVVGTKRGRRAWRLRRRDPRQLAAAVRAELVAAIVDRGASVATDATTAELRATAERVLRLPLGALSHSLAESRFGPTSRAERAAQRARVELARALELAQARERPAERLRTMFSLRSLRPGLTASAGSKR